LPPVFGASSARRSSHNRFDGIRHTPTPNTDNTVVKPATAAKPAVAAKPATAVRTPAAPGKTATVTELKPDDAPPPKKRSKLPWILLGVVLLAAIGGGAAWFLLRPTEATANVNEARSAAAPAPKPVFLNLEPFTVNLIEENGEHYLQVGIVYQMTDDKAVDAAKVYMPVLRNKLLLLLSSKRPSELASLDGKNKLVAELITSARDSIPAGTPERGVVGAYLSAFVIQ
jgi:flagellar FliL protein